MKKLITLLLIVCLVLCISSCGSNHQLDDQSDSDIGTTDKIQEEITTTTTTKHIVQSGLTLDELKAFAGSDYQQSNEEDGSTKFSMKCVGEPLNGVALGDNVVEFTLNVTNVVADTADEFLAYAYVGYQNIGQLTYNQLNSYMSVVYIMDVNLLLGGSKELTLGEVVSVIMDQEVININGWTISADFDTTENTVNIYSKYSY